MNFSIKSTLFLLFAAILVSGCEKEYESIEQIDENKIQNYITSQKLSLTKDPSGFYYQILNPGTGSTPKNSEVVFFTYSAKSVDGKVYYPQNAYATYSDFLGYVKPDGWRLGLYKINKGGKVRVVFPSSLGFGRTGTKIIAGNDVLDSELELFDVKTQPELEDVLINRFLGSNNLSGFTKLPGGVYYKIFAPGTGTENVTVASTITIAYTGRLLNGDVFDAASAAKPYVSKLENLIEGWRVGVPLLKKGGKIRLLIPSESGYRASQDFAKIPPNSILDFDIELIDVKNE